MKSNDNIPIDEMLLAEALAAAQAAGLEWCAGYPFKSARGNPCKPQRAKQCCALGALYLAGKTPLSTAICGGARNMRGGLFSARVWDGNDGEMDWARNVGDQGESLGWAFRQAMERRSA